MSNDKCGVLTLVFRPGEPQQLLPCVRRPHKGRHSTDPWLAPRLDAAESEDNAAWAQCDFERTVVTRERDEARADVERLKAEVERLKAELSDASDGAHTGAVESGIAYRRLEQGCRDLHAYAVRLYRAAHEHANDDALDQDTTVEKLKDVIAALDAAPESVKAAAEDAARGGP